MKKRLFLLLNIFLLLIVHLPFHCFADVIEEDKERWKPYYMDVVPSRAVKQWLVPFKTDDRKDIKTIRMISVFGAPRQSYVRGHFHTGVDLIPRRKRGQWVYVYPAAEGAVCSIHLGDPHKTVVIKHKLSDGKIIYTSYKHLQEIYVENGKEVTMETRLGRLYTAREASALGGNYHHLHMEIRKKFDEYGIASWATVKRADLNRRFHDPWKFLKANIKK
ncbi:MAG: M23 family metallopeptidase [bacterium]|nr:M23 family metallopeptidase [bacterium]